MTDISIGRDRDDNVTHIVVRTAFVENKVSFTVPLTDDLLEAALASLLRTIRRPA